MLLFLQVLLLEFLRGHRSSILEKYAGSLMATTGAHDEVEFAGNPLAQDMGVSAAFLDMLSRVAKGYEEAQFYCREWISIDGVHTCWSLSRRCCGPH